MAIKYLSDGNPDGTVLGNDSADLIAFYNATPTARPVMTAYTYTTVAQTQTSPFGFSASSTLVSIQNLLKALREALVTLGLVTT